MNQFYNKSALITAFFKSMISHNMGAKLNRTVRLASCLLPLCLCLVLSMGCTLRTRTLIPDAEVNHRSVNSESKGLKAKQSPEIKLNNKGQGGLLKPHDGVPKAQTKKAVASEPAVGVPNAQITKAVAPEPLDRVPKAQKTKAVASKPPDRVSKAQITKEVAPEPPDRVSKTQITKAVAPEPPGRVPKALITTAMASKPPDRVSKAQITKSVPPEPTGRVPKARITTAMASKPPDRVSKAQIIKAVATETPGRVSKAQITKAVVPEPPGRVPKAQIVTAMAPEPPGETFKAEITEAQESDNSFINSFEPRPNNSDLVTTQKRVTGQLTPPGEASRQLIQGQDSWPSDFESRDYSLIVTQGQPSPNSSRFILTETYFPKLGPLARLRGGLQERLHNIFLEYVYFPYFIAFLTFLYAIVFIYNFSSYLYSKVFRE